MAERILILEDEFLIALSYRLELEKHGYEVVGVCGDAERAMAISRNNPPDVVIIDVYIKGDIDGVEFLRMLRANGIDPKAVFITGNFDQSTSERVLAMDPLALLFKPAGTSELLDILESGAKPA
jgi:DNA-binding NarL/FixJ family response regulator